MPTPQIFRKRQRILDPGVLSIKGPLAPLGGADSRQLGFDMEKQEQTNWCWSAVATSVSHFFDTQSTWKQCLLANKGLSQSSCCQQGNSAGCNQPYYLERALSEVGHNRGDQSGPLSFDNVRKEIDSGRPVGCFINWNTGGVGHFVIIEGYRTQGTTRRVHIEDPFHGAADYAFDDFRARYLNASGSWTHTYLTR